VLQDAEGTIKLADFGSAKKIQTVREKDKTAEAEPDYSGATPLWAAPEVVTGGECTAAVDIWSLGCVVIEMVSGQPPWAEQSFTNTFRALYHIGHSDAIPVIPESLSPNAKDFVKLCLTRDPSKRPSAADLQKHRWIAEDSATAATAVKPRLSGFNSPPPSASTGASAGAATNSPVNATARASSRSVTGPPPAPPSFLSRPTGSPTAAAPISGRFPAPSFLSTAGNATSPKNTPPLPAFPGMKAPILPTLPALPTTPPAAATKKTT